MSLPIRRTLASSTAAGRRSLSCSAASCSAATLNLARSSNRGFNKLSTGASRVAFTSLPSTRRSFHVSPLSLEAETIRVPSMAESITEGTLKQWLKKKGDYVEADEEVATIETDKIDVSVNAPKAGTITETLAEEEDTVTVGQDLFKLEPGEGGGDKPSAESAKSEPQAEKEAETPEKKEKVKEEVKEGGAPKEEQPKKPKAEGDGGKKASSGGDKKVKEEPTKETTKKQEKAPEPKPKEASSSGAPNRGETRVKMSRMRQRIAERLKQSQNSAASLTTFNEIDMSSLMSMRSKYKDQILKNTGVKIGFMSAFARAACIALKEVPAANASIEGDGAGEQIVYRDYVDLSVAVATPKGLVTPVLRNAENMSFLEIEQGIADLGKKARDNKLTLEDMAGGSFTIIDSSNGGVFGSLFGTPIINVPQAGVLGMHAINDKPVVVDGQIVIRPIMVVALTYDHRLLDGREAVTFLVRIKQLIEDPRAMLFVLFL